MSLILSFFDSDPSFEVKFWRPIVFAGTLLLFLIPSIFTCSILWNRKRIKSSSYFSPPTKPIVPAKPIDTKETEKIIDDVGKLIMNPNYEVKPERLKANPNDETQIIGRGCFGVVVKGTLDGKKVAVKCAKDVNPGYEQFWHDVMSRQLLFQEICLLSLLPRNTNLLYLKGAVTKGWNNGGKLQMALELCENNLEKMVKNIKRQKEFVNQLIYLTDAELAESKHPSPSRTMYEHERRLPIQPVTSNQLSTSDLISFGYQTALGMEFLSSYQCLHRDLAARNLLIKKIDDQWIVKICDFGLARQIEETKQYYLQLGAAQPVHWISPEALIEHKYTSAADVWSYGIVLYELFTLGDTPFGQKSKKEIEEELMAKREKLIAVRPEYCHDQLFNFIENCWYYEATRRPTFKICADQFENHLERANPEKLALLQKILFMND